MLLLVGSVLSHVITGVVIGMAVEKVAETITIAIKGIINKRRLMEELAKQKKTIAAKIEKVDREGGTVTLEQLDRYGQSVAEKISVTGDKIADDVSEGDLIELVA